jgi:hypothetical protein
MNTEEMYRRGVADAEKGDPHPFYYQHYYQYRRGYDHARRRLGLPGGVFDPRRRRNRVLAIVALVAIAAALFVWRERVQTITSGAPQISPTAMAATSAPTRTPIFATPTSQPTATPLVLGVGGTATVTNTQGAALRGRKEPGTRAAVTASFKEGEQLRVVEGPVEADGFTWWRVEGSSGAGWSAQQSKEGIVWLQPVAGS